MKLKIIDDMKKRVSIKYAYLVILFGLAAGLLGVYHYMNNVPIPICY